MPSDKPEIPAQLHRQLWPPLIVGGVFVVGFWADYVAQVFFDTALWGRKSGPPSDFDKRFALGAAVVVTVVVAIVLWRIVRRGLALIERGVRADATMVDVGGVGGHGQMPVTFAYVVGGRRYTVTESVDIDVLNVLDRASVVGVVYDPKSPGRATLLRGELPSPPAQGVREAVVGGAREVVAYWIDAVLFFGVWLATFVLFSRVIGAYELIPDDESSLKTPAAVLAAGLALAAVTVREWLRTRGDWRLRKVNRNLAIMSVAMIVGAVVWGVSEVGSVRRKVAERGTREVEKEQMREMTRNAESAGKLYEEFKARQATRPASRPARGAAGRPSGRP